LEFTHDIDLIVIHKSKMKYQFIQLSIDPLRIKWLSLLAACYDCGPWPVTISSLRLGWRVAGSQAQTQYARHMRGREHMDDPGGDAGGVACLRRLFRLDVGPSVISPSVHHARFFFIFFKIIFYRNIFSVS